MEVAAVHFARPAWLLAVPLGVLLAWWLRRRTGAAGGWRGVCDPHLLPHLVVGNGGGGGRLPYALFALCWALAATALAGPSWERLAQPVYRSGTARVVALDLSRSMQAADVQPSRLGRARFKAADLLTNAGDAQLGLVAFAGDAFVVAPVTDDAATLLNLLPALEPALMPVQGSRADLAIERAGRLLAGAGISHGEVILVGDGVDERAVPAAQALRERGHRLSVLAVGTAEGGPVPSPGGGFLKDAGGNIVLPSTDFDALRALADAGGGRYAALSADDADLRALGTADSLRGQLGGARQAQASALRWRDGGPWLVLTLLPLAALAFRRGWLVVVVLSLVWAPREGYAFEWQDLWWRRDQQAAQAMARGDWDRAAALADGDVVWEGAARYRQQRFAEAAAAFAGDDGAAAHYNRGNALAREGKLEQALAAYGAALERDPELDDARHNREVVERALAEERRRQQAGGASAGGNEQGGGEAERSGGRRGDSDQARRQGGREQAGQVEPSEGASGESGQRQQAERGRSPAGSSTTPSTSELGGDGPVTSGSEADSTQTASRPHADAPAQPGAGTASDDNAAADQLAAVESETDAESESAQALEQWLRRIPDDPGGLLRRKFQREHERRGGALGSAGPQW